jgi:hypothetical protein
MFKERQFFYQADPNVEIHFKSEVPHASHELVKVTVLVETVERNTEPIRVDDCVVIEPGADVVMINVQSADNYYDGCTVSYTADVNDPANSLECLKLIRDFNANKNRDAGATMGRVNIENGLWRVLEITPNRGMVRLERSGGHGQVWVRIEQVFRIP